MTTGSSSGGEGGEMEGAKKEGKEEGVRKGGKKIVESGIKRRRGMGEKEERIPL